MTDEEEYRAAEKAAMEADRRDMEDEGHRAREAEERLEARFIAEMAASFSRRQKAEEEKNRVWNEYQGTGSSWEPIDLGAYVDNPNAGPHPFYFERIDGKALLYPELTHYFIGEPESGKSFAAMAATKHVLDVGDGVVYIDYEDGPFGFFDKMTALGVPGDILRDDSRLAYIRPAEHLKAEEAKRAFAHAADGIDGVALIVIDGVTEAMALAGLSGRDEGDVARFHAAMPRMFERGGAAIIMIDHVVKSKDQRGRWAIGSEHKLAAVTGAAYKFEVQERIARGRAGKVRVTVTKDRPGRVREFADGDTVGIFHVRPTEDPDRVTATLEPMSYDDLIPSDDRRNAVVEFVEANPDCTKTAIVDGVGGTAEDVRAVIDLLVSDGTMKREERGRGQYHRLA